MQHDSELISPPRVSSPASSASPIAFAITAAADGRMIEANDRFLCLFGLERECALGHTFDDLRLFGPSSRRRGAGVTHGPSAPPRRIRVHVPGGDYREIHLSASPFQVAGHACVLTLFEDLTERRRTERILRETMERFRCTFDHAFTGMAVISTEARWLKVNPALCQMLGRTEDELLDTPVAGVSRPGDRELDGEDLRRLLARDVENVQIEKQLLARDGRVVPVIMNLALLWGESGDPRYLVCQVVEKRVGGRDGGVVVAESESAALPAFISVSRD